jgi:hypothetical protein
MNPAGSLSRRGGWPAVAGLVVCALLAAARARAETLDAQALPGFTGYAVAPSARTLGHKDASLSLHKFLMGLAYGWPRGAEFGASFDLKDVTPITPFTRKTFRARAPFVNLHAKWRGLRAERHGLDLAVGQWRHTTYLAAAPRPFRGFRLDAGPSLRRRTDDTYEKGYFAALAWTGAYQTAFVDYDAQARAGGAGWRYLLSDAIRLDILITPLGRRHDAFDRIFFGLTIAN